MTKTEMLLIRACKSKNPMDRVIRLYNRFYYVSGMRYHIKIGYISLILTNLCDKYMPINASWLLNALNPDSYWRFGIKNHDDYNLKVIKILISHISLYSVSGLPDDHKRPAKFRKVD